MPASLLAQWREANRVAEAAELELYEAALLHARGHGPPPSPEQLRKIARLRANSMELFNLAVEQFDLSPIVTKAGARALSHMSDANTPN